MKDSLFISNISFNENEEEDNNSLFQFNKNSLFQKEDSSFNYFNNIAKLNGEEEAQMNNNNEFNLNDIENNNFENDFQYKNNMLQENESNINRDFSLMSPIPINEENSYKLINNNNFENNEISKDEILCKEGSLSGAGSDDTPLSTGGTGLKNQSKETSFNNSNINNNNKNKINTNFISFINEKINNNKKTNNKNDDKSVLSKKRKQRIHLEDLNIDPEIIKYKKYQTIGDKVITSKNSVITDLDKKEIRAIRNRISAQKSRDRKKAEFLSMQKQIKYLQEKIEKQNLIIQNFEKLSCSNCKSKLNELHKLLIENNEFNISEQLEIHNENEYLVLDENSIISEKKNSLIGKISGALIALVCLIGIILCVIEGGYTLSYKNILIEENNGQLNVRHLTETNNMDIDENENISNINIIDDERDIIDITVPSLPIKSNRMNQYEYNLSKLQIYHDKFGLDIYSFLKKKRKEKNKFLMKKPFYNDSIIDNSLCIETNNIEHNNYIIDNNSKNTLPVEASNIVIDNKLSHRIISLFVKDYDTLQRFIDGRSLSLQEQIEIEAKNSEDGCIYLQMIIPKYKIDRDENNETYTTFENGFFEIRGKIFAYNNYYDSKVAASF